jgi:hypothetical protein
MEIRSLSIMLYKRFRIRFKIRLRRKIDVYSKTNYCSGCDNYRQASCALGSSTLKACCKEYKRWISSRKAGPKYLPDAPKEIEDLK